MITEEKQEELCTNGVNISFRPRKSILKAFKLLRKKIRLITTNWEQKTENKYISMLGFLVQIITFFANIFMYHWWFHVPDKINTYVLLKYAMRLCEVPGKRRFWEWRWWRVRRWRIPDMQPMLRFCDECRLLPWQDEHPWIVSALPIFVSL
jgi:hypothetical protein